MAAAGRYSSRRSHRPTGRPVSRSRQRADSAESDRRQRDKEIRRAASRRRQRKQEQEDRERQAQQQNREAILRERKAAAKEQAQRVRKQLRQAKKDAAKRGIVREDWQMHVASAPIHTDTIDHNTNEDFEANSSDLKKLRNARKLDGEQLRGMLQTEVEGHSAGGPYRKDEGAHARQIPSSGLHFAAVGRPNGPGVAGLDSTLPFHETIGRDAAPPAAAPVASLGPSSGIGLEKTLPFHKTSSRSPVAIPPSLPGAEGAGQAAGPQVRRVRVGAPSAGSTRKSAESSLSGESQKSGSADLGQSAPRAIDLSLSGSTNRTHNDRVPEAASQSSGNDFHGKTDLPTAPDDPLGTIHERSLERSRASMPSGRIGGRPPEGIDTYKPARSPSEALAGGRPSSRPGSEDGTGVHQVRQAVDLPGPRYGMGGQGQNDRYRDSGRPRGGNTHAMGPCAESRRGERILESGVDHKQPPHEDLDDSLSLSLSISFDAGNARVKRKRSVDGQPPRSSEKSKPGEASGNKLPSHEAPTDGPVRMEIGRAGAGGAPPSDSKRGIVAAGEAAQPSVGSSIAGRLRDSEIFGSVDVSNRYQQDVIDTQHGGNGGQQTSAGAGDVRKQRGVVAEPADLMGLFEHLPEDEDQESSVSGSFGFLKAGDTKGLPDGRLLARDEPAGAESAVLGRRRPDHRGSVGQANRSVSPMVTSASSRSKQEALTAADRIKARVAQRQQAQSAGTQGLSGDTRGPVDLLRHPGRPRPPTANQFASRSGSRSRFEAPMESGPLRAVRRAVEGSSRVGRSDGDGEMELESVRSGTRASTRYAGSVRSGRSRGSRRGGGGGGVASSSQYSRGRQHAGAGSQREGNGSSAGVSQRPKGHSQRAWGSDRGRSETGSSRSRGIGSGSNHKGAGPTRRAAGASRSSRGSSSSRSSRQPRRPGGDEDRPAWGKGEQQERRIAELQEARRRQRTYGQQVLHQQRLRAVVAAEKAAKSSESPEVGTPRVEARAAGSATDDHSISQQRDVQRKPDGRAGSTSRVAAGSSAQDEVDSSDEEYYLRDEFIGQSKRAGGRDGAALKAARDGMGAGADLHARDGWGAGWLDKQARDKAAAESGSGSENVLSTTLQEERLRASIERLEVQLQRRKHADGQARSDQHGQANEQGYASGSGGGGRQGVRDSALALAVRRTRNILERGAAGALGVGMGMGMGNHPGRLQQDSRSAVARGTDHPAGQSLDKDPRSSRGGMVPAPVHQRAAEAARGLALPSERERAAQAEHQAQQRALEEDRLRQELQKQREQVRRLQEQQARQAAELEAARKAAEEARLEAKAAPRRMWQAARPTGRPASAQPKRQIGEGRSALLRGGAAFLPLPSERERAVHGQSSGFHSARRADSLPKRTNPSGMPPDQSLAHALASRPSEARTGYSGVTHDRETNHDSGSARLAAEPQPAPQVRRVRVARRRPGSLRPGGPSPSSGLNREQAAGNNSRPSSAVGSTSAWRADQPVSGKVLRSSRAMRMLFQ